MLYAVSEAIELADAVVTPVRCRRDRLTVALGAPSQWPSESSTALRLR